MKSGRLLFVQFACIGGLLLTGPLFAAPPWIWLELAGLGILTWAVFTMQPHRVSPLPDVRRDARLVTHGPYRWVRHPMYTGLLLAMLALVFDKWTIWRSAIWLILLANLLEKLSYEERLLAQRFPAYADYRRQTRKLLPFVY